MSTHKITPETKVPFPCWLNLRATGWNYYFGQVEADAQNFAQECATHYSTNPPDQPPLGEPAPEGSLPVTDEFGSVTEQELDGALTHIKSVPFATTHSAPSPQSVAEGAARQIAKDYGMLAYWYCARDTITRHFAPLLANTVRKSAYDYLAAQYRKLETDNNTLREAQKACEDCMTPTYAALRTRCEELERDKAALVETGSELDATLAKCTHLTGESETLDLERAKLRFRAALAAARKEGQQAHQKGQKPDTYNARKHEESQP